MFLYGDHIEAHIPQSGSAMPKGARTMCVSIWYILEIRLQGVAGDCKSSEETHEWFDSISLHQVL